MSLVMDLQPHTPSGFEDSSLLMHDKDVDELSVLGIAHNIGGSVVLDCLVLPTSALTDAEVEEARPLKAFMDSDGHVTLPQDPETFLHAA